MARAELQERVEGLEAQVRKLKEGIARRDAFWVKEQHGLPSEAEPVEKPLITPRVDADPQWLVNRCEKLERELDAWQRKYKAAEGSPETKRYFQKRAYDLSDEVQRLRGILRSMGLGNLTHVLGVEEVTMVNESLTDREQIYLQRAEAAERILDSIARALHTGFEGGLPEHLELPAKVKALVKEHHDMGWALHPEDMGR